MRDKKFSHRLAMVSIAAIATVTTAIVAPATASAAPPKTDAQIKSMCSQSWDVYGHTDSLTVYVFNQAADGSWSNTLGPSGTWTVANSAGETFTVDGGTFLQLNNEKAAAAGMTEDYFQSGNSYTLQNTTAAAGHETALLGVNNNGADGSWARMGSAAATFSYFPYVAGYTPATSTSLQQCNSIPTNIGQEWGGTYFRDGQKNLTPSDEDLYVAPYSEAPHTTRWAAATVPQASSLTWTAKDSDGTAVAGTSWTVHITDQAGRIDSGTPVDTTLTVTDNGENDEDPAVGSIKLSHAAVADLEAMTSVTVTPASTPAGYDATTAQSTDISYRGGAQSLAFTFAKKPSEPSTGTTGETGNTGSTTTKPSTGSTGPTSSTTGTSTTAPGKTTTGTTSGSSTSTTTTTSPTTGATSPSKPATTSKPTPTTTTTKTATKTPKPTAKDSSTTTMKITTLPITSGKSSTTVTKTPKTKTAAATKATKAAASSSQPQSQSHPTQLAITGTDITTLTYLTVATVVLGSAATIIARRRKTSGIMMRAHHGTITTMK
jgi:mucin-2